MKTISAFIAFFAILFCLSLYINTESAQFKDERDGSEYNNEYSEFDISETIFVVDSSIDSDILTDGSESEDESTCLTGNSEITTIITPTAPATTTTTTTTTTTLTLTTTLDTTQTPTPTTTTTTTTTTTFPSSPELPDQGNEAYIAPYDMYAPVYTSKALGGGDYELKRGIIGLKVEAVQKALGMELRHYGRYTEKTKELVSRFQSNNDLDVTGIVDLQTWETMGLSYEDWLYMGAYVHPIVIEKSYTKNQIIEAFIDVGKSYIGTEFVIGASGMPGEGVDCSGYVLQCLYAIGIYPDGIDPVQHSVENEYNCIAMYNDSKFRDIEYSELRPGDLVFYKSNAENNKYPVNHVAIYIGDGKCLEAWIDSVDVYRIDKLYLGYELIGYRRVIW